MESDNNNNTKCCSGGVIIGIISLVENWIKGLLSIYILTVGIPYVDVTKGLKKLKCRKKIEKFFLDKIHADIYTLLSIFGVFCSLLLISGALKKYSGKIIWWICFQGISIFHQIFFSIDVVYAIYQRVVSRYTITICILVALFLLLYIIIEIYFMSFIVELYQTIAESEIDNMPHRRHRMTVSTISSSRQDHLRRDLSDRNNPMQSSIIKLLAELEGNDTTSSSDTIALIK